VLAKWAPLHPAWYLIRSAQIENSTIWQFFYSRELILMI
jgi:hypothetical protein